MRIIVDILTPKQCMFFMKICERLDKRGHEVLKTTRKYREVLELLDLRGMRATLVGEHGGKALNEKLRKSAERTRELASVFDDARPDVSVSFSSPEMARVSFGLGVPHICINDSPHAEAVARLTIPLSKKLMSPWVIPKSAWTRYGISLDNIVRYHALDPWVWLGDFAPNPEILKELGLNGSRPILTFRPEESHASYLLDKAKEGTSIAAVIERLLDAHRGLQIVALPRYAEHMTSLQEAFGDRVVVPGSAIDSTSLLCYTTVFVGAGGTMNAEAALLGVPTISCYPDEPTLIDEYLIKRKLVLRETDPERMVKEIWNMVGDSKRVRQIWARRSRRMTKNFNDPTRAIVDEIEKYG